MLDDLFTYRLGPDRFLTVTNASNHEKDLAWFREHAGDFDVELADAHERWAMLAVQGPEARGGGRARSPRASCRRGCARPTLESPGVDVPRLRHGLHRRGRRASC